jgi:hypothetical protein
MMGREKTVRKRPQSMHSENLTLVRQQVLGNQAFQRLIQTERKRSLQGNTLPDVTIAAAPEEPADASPEVLHELEATQYARPFTAVALIAKREIATCKIPSNRFGASKVLKYRIIDVKGQPVREAIAVGEKFTLLEGPEEYFKLLKPVAKKTDKKGFFDDCYRMYARNPLPKDIRLKIEQNHIVDGQTISKNHITYTPNSVMVCVFRRPQGQPDFEKRCKWF